MKKKVEPETLEEHIVAGGALMFVRVWHVARETTSDGSARRPAGGLWSFPACSVGGPTPTAS